MLGEVPRTEATPFVYYVVAWPWGSVFGLGEVGLRSLSALAGTATIPVAYGAGAVLVSRRAGLVAAALVATNPFLVWYSQEARSYALLALFGAASVLAFGLALRGDRRWLGGWAVVSALAIATHYFAVFVVGAEAAWLLVRVRPRLAGRPRIARPGRDAPRPLPLVLDQRGNGEAVAGSSLAARIAGIPKNLVVGYSFPLEAAGSVVAALLVLVGVVLVVRLARESDAARSSQARSPPRSCSPRWGSRLSAPTTSSRGTRSQPSSPPLSASGRDMRRPTRARRRTTSVSAVCAAVALAPSLDATYGRTDWRAAAEVLGTTEGPRAIVVTPYMSRTLWQPYLPGLGEPVGAGARWKKSPRSGSPPRAGTPRAA